jgi:hypothetical protein
VIGIVPCHYTEKAYLKSNMEKNRTIRLNIPSPCKQDWGTMSIMGEVRFCSSCKKEIIDFSELSDSELLQFFQKNPSIHCGRFHNTQLDREISARKKKLALPARLYAALSAILSVISVTEVHAADGGAQSISVSPQQANQEPFTPAEVTISGRVMGEGQPLADVEVKMDQQTVKKTDSGGRFSFSLMVKDPGQSHLLVFTYPGMISLVRNYHAAMQSTNYELSMEKPSIPYSCTMGIINPESFPIMEVYFKPDEVGLSAEHKKILDSAAMSLRSNPSIVISLLGYIRKKADEKVINKWQNMIRGYLVNDQGISSDRFKFETIQADTGTEMLIQLKAQDFY